MGLSYDDAVTELYGLAGRGITPGLASLEQALVLADHPELGLGQVVHIAGTNGKGSVAAMVEAGVGAPTGRYTSPHLHRLLERVQLRPEPLTPEAFAAAYDALRTLLRGAPPLSFFETVTLLAFRLLAAAAPTVTVLEVGLGGRLDATNVVSRPAVTVVTRVHLDHQRFLGDTVEAIAREKAGILKRGVPVLLGRQPEGALAALEARAAEVGARPVLRLGRELTWEEAPDGSLTVRLEERAVSGLRPSLPGRHQRDNAALAVGALLLLGDRGVPVRPEAAVADVRWPGRLEHLPGAPALLLDGAHNEDAAAALAAYLEDHPVPGRRVLLFAAMADKAWERMLGHLTPRVGDVVTTRVALARGEDPSRLAEVASGVAVPAPLDALRAAEEKAGPDGLVVVAGSLFLVAAVRAARLGLPQDPPIAM